MLQDAEYEGKNEVHAGKIPKLYQKINYYVYCHQGKHASFAVHGTQ